MTQPAQVQTRGFSDPAAVSAELERIHFSLAYLQNDLEDAAKQWFPLKAQRAKEEATAFIRSGESSDAKRRNDARASTAHIGAEHEGRWEGLRAVQRALDTQANICMSLLKSQGRA